jgi:hypothetical protein
MHVRLAPVSPERELLCPEFRAFCRKNCVFTKGLDKIALCDVDLLIQLVVFSLRSGLTWVVKGLRTDKK